MDANVLKREPAKYAPRRWLKQATQQANAIIEAHKGNVEAFVLAPNVRPGSGFLPLTGYAMQTTLDAQFVAAHYDTQNLFRGRCALAMLPPGLADEQAANKLRAAHVRLENAELLGLYEKSKAWALRKVNDNASLMSLQESARTEGWGGLFYDESSGGYMVAVEAQMVPHADTLGTDISSYIIREAEPGLSVSQAFFKGHPLGRTMIRYLQAQKAYREHLCRKLRRKLVKHFLGADYYRDICQVEDKAAHFVTNIANKSPGNASFLYYSMTLEATMPGGAMIFSGPFKRAVWANWNGDGGNALASAGMLRALPFNVPRAQRLHDTLVDVIVHRKSEKRDAENFALVYEHDQNAEEADFTHLTHELVKTPERSGGVGPLGFGRRQDQIVGDFVFPYYRHHSGAQVEVYSPYEMLDYTRGLENETTRAAMKMLGIDLGKSGMSNSTLAPLFLAGDQPYALSAVALAEALRTTPQ